MTKYQYHRNGESGAVVPCVSLIEGQKGVIKRVDFYSNADYFRGERINFSLDNDDVQEKMLGRLRTDKLLTLEEFNDEELQKLATERQNTMVPRLPLDELKEIRELEIALRAEHGDEYRSTR